MPVGKSLTDAQNERVRAAVKILRPRFSSQKDLAERLGIDGATLSRFLAGSLGTSIHVATIVAELMGVDVITLLDPSARPAQGIAVSDDPAFPSRSRAEVAARVLDCSDDDIRAAIEAHDIPEDPGDVYWITEFLRARDRRRRREALADPGGEQPSSRLTRVIKVRTAHDK